MGLQFAHGAIQWLAADSVNATYTVSGLPFRPKAIRFYWQGLGSASDANSATAHFRRGVGFATSPSDRRCVATEDQDAAGTQVCVTGHSASAAVMTITSTPAADGLLDVDLITDQGFRMIVDDATPVDLTVFWEAWGGDAITGAATGQFQEPAATGDVDYTVTGNLSPSVVMFAGVQGTSLDTVARNDSGLYVGAATGPGENIVVVGNSDDASATSDTDGYCQSGQCLAMIVVGGGTSVDARASMTQWNSNGFRLNWAARATTNRVSIYLAIQGGAWKAGSYTIEGQTSNATASVTGLPFTPIGLSLMGRKTAQSTASTASAQDVLCLGTGTSPTSRRAMGGWSEDALGTAAEIDLTMQYDQVLAVPDGAGGLSAAYDINSMDPSGFSVIVDTNGGVTAEWQGYLAFGSLRHKFNNYQAIRVADGMSTTERIR